MTPRPLLSDSVTWSRVTFGESSDDTYTPSPVALAPIVIVQVGAPVDGRVSVAAGLDPGESVVVEPPVTLVDGSPVRPTSRPEGAGASSAPSGEARR